MILILVYWAVCDVEMRLHESQDEPQPKSRRFETANQPNQSQARQNQQNQSLTNQVQYNSRPNQIQLDLSHSFFAQHPIREAFQFEQPCVQALHGLPYTTVGNFCIGNHPPQHSSISGKPKHRGKDKGKRNPKPRRCMSCVRNGNVQWVCLCLGSTPRGKCEYFDSSGNRIKPVDQPPAPRGSAKNK